MTMNSGNAEKLIESVANHFLKFRNLQMNVLLNVAYLCDWKHFIEYGHSISNCEWKIESNRIRSLQFEKIVARHPALSIEEEGLYAPIHACKKLTPSFPLGSTEKRVCEHIFFIVDQQPEFRIERICLSTYPFKYRGKLDFETLRAEYVQEYGTEFKFEDRNSA